MPTCRAIGRKEVYMNRNDLIDAINQLEPDDYSDWTVEELQELAINLGIAIF